MSTGTPKQDPRRTQIPEAVDVALDNGLQLLVVPVPGNPYLAAHLELPAGSLGDPAEEEGLAAFTAQLLRHGTRRRSEAELSEAIDGLGARLSTATYLDHVDVGGDVTTLDPKNGELLLAAMAEIVREPTFPEAEIAKVRALREGGIRRLADQNDQVAARAFEQATLQGQLAGRPVSGSVASLRRIDRPAIEGFWQRHYLPQGARLGIAGDITVEQAVALATRTFGSWTGTPEPLPDSPLPPPTAGRRLLLVDKKDPSLSQVHFRIGAIAPVRTDSMELYPYRLAAHILGGDFSARLNQRLRVREGLTYGARFSYRPTTNLPGTAGLVTYVELDLLARALQCSLEELHRFRAEGPQEQELADARDKLVLSFPFRFETPTGTLDQISWLRREGLPRDFLARYQERLDSVTFAAVQDMAAHGFPAGEDCVLVAVGNKEQARALAETFPGTSVEVLSLADLGLC